MTCPFCRKIEAGGDEHGPVAPVVEFRPGDIYRSEPLVEPVPGEVYRFAPLNPVTKGHLLFVPREHVADASEHPHLAGACFAAAAAHGFVMAEPFNLITSAGTEATQTVRHLHIHYVPRRAGDGLALPWSTP